MEQIDIADMGTTDVSIERCRELLGADAVGWSDDDVECIRRHADMLAHAVIELFLKDRPTIQ